MEKLGNLRVIGITEMISDVVVALSDCVTRHRKE